MLELDAPERGDGPHRPCAWPSPGAACTFDRAPRARGAPMGAWLRRALTAGAGAADPLRLSRVGQRMTSGARIRGSSTARRRSRPRYRAGRLGDDRAARCRHLDRRNRARGVRAPIAAANAQRPERVGSFGALAAFFVRSPRSSCSSSAYRRRSSGWASRAAATSPGPANRRRRRSPHRRANSRRSR